MRPGTDGALALAMMYELIAHNWLDEDYIARHLEGFEALRAKALAWSPERAAANCAMVRVYNERGDCRCRADVSKRARPGVVNGCLGMWWRKLGLAGTNVNELTHQRLTDLGRAAAFYDCLVEVVPT